MYYTIHGKQLLKGRVVINLSGGNSGILCECCQQVISCSGFEAHAGAVQCGRLHCASAHARKRGRRTAPPLGALYAVAWHVAPHAPGTSDTGLLRPPHMCHGGYACAAARLA